MQIYTQPDRPAGRSLRMQASAVKSFCLSHGLPIKTVANINEESVLEEIASLKCASAVVVAFGQILSEKFFSLFPLGCVNLHASLLPRCEGRLPSASYSGRI